MKSQVSRELALRFRSQHGVVARTQLRALGLDDRAIRRKVAVGDWEAVGPHLVRLAGTEQTHEQLLLGACLAAGPATLASHSSAAWLWELSGPPARHSIIVPRWASARQPGVEVHRPAQFPAEVSHRRQIPCTNPLRTLVDVAGVWPPDELDNAIDKALARKLVTVEALRSELQRQAKHGRPGIERVREALDWRSPAGAMRAGPSVLESRVLRLLRRAGIKPLAIEVDWSAGGLYRLDILLAPGLAMEVDGYSYHHSPDQMTADARRRNRLFLSGVVVLVYTWKDVAYDGHRVLAEVLNAMSAPAADLPLSTRRSTS